MLQAFTYFYNRVKKNVKRKLKIRGTIKVEEALVKLFTLHSIIMNKLWSIFLNSRFYPRNKLIKSKRNSKSRIFTFVVNI